VVRTRNVDGDVLSFVYFKHNLLNKKACGADLLLLKRKIDLYWCLLQRNDFCLGKLSRKVHCLSKYEVERRIFISVNLKKKKIF
jgi:hypothetical protein